ncbi:MAG: DUF6754 domain-containing protein [Chloroflexota bacterium]
MSATTAFAFVFLVFFCAIWLLRFSMGRDRAPTLRHIPAFDMMRGSLAAAAEDGRPIHVGLGTGGIADGHAMETIAGLAALEFFGEQAAITSNVPLVTTGNPTTLLLAQDTLSRPFAERDHLAQFDPLAVRFMGGLANQTGAAYAAGVLDLLNRRDVAANYMLGHFDDEYLLLGDAGARNAVPQVAGAASTNALPFMALTADRVLLGEELFATGAYLLRRPWHIAGLAAQDTARWIIVGAVGVLVALRTLGLF